MKLQLLASILIFAALPLEAATPKQLLVRLTNYWASENTFVTVKEKVTTHKVVTTRKKDKKGKLQICKKKVKVTKIKSRLVDTDPDTKHGRTSTGLPLCEAAANAVGIASVDLSLIAAKSPIEVTTLRGKNYYIAGDTGSAVIKRTAAKKTGKTVAEKAAPVIDLCGRNLGTSPFDIVKVIDYRTLAPREQGSIIDPTGHGNLAAVKKLFRKQGGWSFFGGRFASR